jgi:hypothetical protein
MSDAPRVHNIKAVLEIAAVISVGEVRVQTARELREAAKQRPTQIVVDDDWLAARIERWRNLIAWGSAWKALIVPLLIAWMFSALLEHRYSITVEWDVTKRSGKLILTPPSP